MRQRTCCAGRQTKKDCSLQFRPLCDGVFRAVPPTVNAKEFCGKILQQVLSMHLPLPCLCLTYAPYRHSLWAIATAIALLKPHSSLCSL